MKTTGNVVAWPCIFSTLLVGCYYSALIDPNGAERDNINSDKIEYLIMKDSTKLGFDTPLSMSDSTLTYQRREPVSIPMSDVLEFGPVDDKGTLYMDKLQFVVTKDSLKYEFITPPRVIHEKIVGVAVKETVTIPLSDVALVYTREIDPVGTTLGVLGTFAIGTALFCAGVASAIGK